MLKLRYHQTINWYSSKLNNLNVYNETTNYSTTNELLKLSLRFMIHDSQLNQIIKMASCHMMQATNVDRSLKQKKA